MLAFREILERVKIAPQGANLMLLYRRLGCRFVACFIKAAQENLSILERVSPAMSIEDITTPQQGWMRHLHARTDGLNR
tara:strand:+ start:67 stop:303 length:237 start_codon:yes stop_codon:yes gene_type:complete